MYYKNIQLQIQLKIITLETELKNINTKDNVDVVLEIQENQNELDRLKSKIESLIDNFISSSEIMQAIIEKKIKEFESKVQAIEDEIARLKLIKSDKEKHIRKINNNILKLKQELLVSNDKELTREEWLDKVDKILISSKIDIKTVYKLD